MTLHRKKPKSPSAVLALLFLLYFFQAPIYIKGKLERGHHKAIPAPRGFSCMPLYMYHYCIVVEGRAEMYM